VKIVNKNFTFARVPHLNINLQKNPTITNELLLNYQKKRSNKEAVRKISRKKNYRKAAQDETPCHKNVLQRVLVGKVEIVSIES